MPRFPAVRSTPTRLVLLLAVAAGTTAGPTRSAVFVKTPKCGGTTISHCFINHAAGANLAVYHATGPFVLNEAKVRAAKAALADGASAGFGLLYNHGGRRGWMNSVMASTPKCRFPGRKGWNPPSPALTSSPPRAGVRLVPSSFWRVAPDKEHRWASCGEFAMLNFEVTGS